MSDSLRTGDTRQVDVTSDAERDAKIEQLLVAGLDHYFAARYEQAVNVWTRVLFLDRGHSRACAYIDRARTALAERQRESEELLQRGVAAFQSGDVNEAKRLLRAAIDGGAVADDAHPLLARLDHEGVAAAPADQADPSPTGSRAAATRRAPAPSVVAGVRWNYRIVAGGALIAAFVAGMFALVTRDGDVRAVFASRQEAANPGATGSAREGTLPIPQRGELALSNARALAARGRLHEALSVLEMVRPTDPQRQEADRVRADLQHQLLGLTPEPRASSTPDR